MLTAEILLANSAGKTRRAWLNGREYLVAPLTTIVPGVLSGSKGALFYPPEEISRNHADWNDRPITLYHPTDPLTGEHLSADHDGVRERQGLGFLRNTTANGKLKHEGWFDAERTRSLDKRVYDNLVKNRPMELSTGLYTDNEPAPAGSNFRGKPYSFTARNYRPDHLAVLPDQRGACSISDGCGVLVNRLVFNRQNGLVDLPARNAGTAKAPGQARDNAGQFSSAKGKGASGGAAAASAEDPAAEAPTDPNAPDADDGPVDPLTGDPLYKGGKGGGKTHNLLTDIDQTVNEFSSDDQRRAFFGLMAKATEKWTPQSHTGRAGSESITPKAKETSTGKPGPQDMSKEWDKLRAGAAKVDAQEKSNEALEKTKSANKGSRASGHFKAAALHAEAAEMHSKLGNKEQASQHQSLQAHHEAKAKTSTRNESSCSCGGACKKCRQWSNNEDLMETNDDGDMGGLSEDSGGGESMETNDDYGVTPQTSSSQAASGASGSAQTASAPNKPTKPVKASAAGSAEAISKTQDQVARLNPASPKPAANAAQVKMPGKRAPKKAAAFEDASEELHEDDAPAMLVGKQPPNAVAKRGDGRGLADLETVTEDLVGGAQDDHQNLGLGHVDNKKGCSMTTATMNDFASDDQRRAFFGHMGSGGGGEKSSAARSASEHADSTKSKSAHLTAAKAHREASAHHNEKADYADTAKEKDHHEGLAAGHAQAAKYHAAKAGKAIRNSRNQRDQRGTTMTRSEFINQLIANGEATESDRPALKAMELSTLNALFKKKNKRDDEEDEDDDEDEDDEPENNDDTNVHSFDSITPKKAGSMQAGGTGTKDEYNKLGVKNQLTMEQWEQAMPAEARAVWNTVKEAETNLKLGLVHQIIHNVRDPKRRNLVGNRLMKLSKVQLEEQLELVGPPPGVTRNSEQGNRQSAAASIFFGDAPVANQSANAIDKTAILAMPTMNFQEIASKDLIEKLKKRA